MAVRLSSTFVFRKLHQLTGILPLGVFLLEHFGLTVEGIMDGVRGVLSHGRR